MLIFAGDKRRIRDLYSCRKRSEEFISCSDQAREAVLSNSRKPQFSDVFYQVGQKVTLRINGRVFDTEVVRASRRGCCLKGLAGSYSHNVLTAIKEEASGRE